MIDASEPDFAAAVADMGLGAIFQQGLTKRELISAMCLQGLLSTLTIERDAHSRFLAETAVMHADALLKELSSNKESGE